MAADPGVCFDRLDGAGVVRGDRPKDIKRLMAYSSIGHMGFALVGLAAGTAEGAQSVIIYMSIYVAMTLGTFSVILAMKRNGQPVEKISDSLVFPDRLRRWPFSLP